MTRARTVQPLGSKNTYVASEHDWDQSPVNLAQKGGILPINRKDLANRPALDGLEILRGSHVGVRLRVLCKLHLFKAVVALIVQARLSGRPKGKR